MKQQPLLIMHNVILFFLLGSPPLKMAEPEGRYRDRKSTSPTSAFYFRSGQTGSKPTSEDLHLYNLSILREPSGMQERPEGASKKYKGGPKECDLQQRISLARRAMPRMARRFNPKGYQ
ncbi:hypothetical protein PVAP13_8KG268901 [Panicum virgatum]|uniref:Uncharacterized protein n=1 Tax=Panicum virgatum TaxID=38727 RepID=A0A8T0PJX9_PANVG|nr:hypothetical protein PVAP13_8KG268901 [Panicum virgatum]